MAIRVSGILFLFLFISTSLLAQKPEFHLSTTGIASTGSSIPFWLVSNQNGKYKSTHSGYFCLEAGFHKDWKENASKRTDFIYGANVVCGYAKESELQINEAYAGFRHSWLDIYAGAKAEPILFYGLSSTNGDILLSNNARPIPKIGISTNRKFYLLKKFAVTASYEEGLLNDDRIVEKAHLHHKSLFLHYDFPRKWYFSLGLDHYVMWGGTHPDLGKNPTTISDYIRYISGLAGGDAALRMDQENAAGNHIGAYLGRIEKQWDNRSLTIYWNHLFEDSSGRELSNFPDALYGFNFHFSKKPQWISHLLYEFYHTTDQSDKPTLHNFRKNDNYFNHGFYRSGYTFHQQTIGAPLFSSVINENGISTGIRNNRFLAHHLGIGGGKNKVYWKGLFTWSRNYGTPNQKYDPKINQCSILGECTLQESMLPFDLSLKIAADFGNLYKKNVGAQLLIFRRF